MTPYLNGQLGCEGSMSQHDTLTLEQLDQHLDAILKASGSALRHYTMQKSRDDMRAALRAALSATHQQGGSK